MMAGLRQMYGIWGPNHGMPDLKPLASVAQAFACPAPMFVCAIPINKTLMLELSAVEAGSLLPGQVVMHFLDHAV